MELGLFHRVENLSQLLFSIRYYLHASLSLYYSPFFQLCCQIKEEKFIVKNLKVARERYIKANGNTTPPFAQRLFLR